MPEPVEISLKVTGDQRLDELIKKLNEGTGSLNDLAKAKRLINEEFKKTELGTEKWKDYAGALAVINDKQRDVRLETKAGHEAYFKAGLELRQLLLATQGASGGFGSFTMILSSSVSNAVQLKQALVPLGVQFGALGIAAASVASLGIQLIGFFNQQEEKARKAAESVRKFKIELIDLDTQAARLRSETAAIGTRGEGRLNIPLEQGRAEELLSRIQGLRAGIVPSFDRYGRPIKLSEEELQQNAEIEKEIKGYKLEILGIEKSITEEKKKQREEAEQAARTGRIFAAMQGFNIPGNDYERALVRQSPFAGYKIERINVPEGWSALTGTGKPGEGIVGALGQEFARTKTLAEELGDTLKASSQQFSRTLIDALVHGKNLAESIGYALLGVLVDVASAGLGSAITSAFSSKPKGTRPSIGGDGEPVPVLSSQRSFSGFGAPMVQVVPILDNAGLAVRVEIGNRVNARRRA